MAILKCINRFLRLIFFIVIILFFSCQRTVDCDNDNGANNISFIFNEESNYVPKKGKLLFFEKDLKNKKYFKSLDLLSARRDNNSLDIYFKNPPDVFKAKYNYRIILDDSLLYDITNIQMKIDTAGRTMGGWAIGCVLMSFEVNGKKYNANEGTLDFPFNSAKKIK